MNYILAIPVFLPILSGLGLLFIKFKDREDVHAYSLIALGISLVATVISNFILMSNELVLFELPMGLSFAFYTDAVAAFFSTIFSVVWFLVAIYSFEYLKHEGNDKRFFAFYLMTLGWLIGVAYADNPFTLYMCFEAMTLSSFALVLHSQTNKSIAAAKNYIYFSMFGAVMGLIGVFYFYSWDAIETKSFVSGGVIPHELGGRMPMVLLVTLIAIVGFSCKSGMFPLHAWLPIAHPEAPAPASSVLSGLITKSGIIAIIRIVFFVVGADVLRGTYVQKLILVLSIVTIFMGSMMAYKEKILKKRLAYSSVSQISYIIFGIMLLSEIGAMGAMLQVAFHALAKNALFLCAGAIIYKTQKTQCSQLDGLGRAMPKTFAA
ncbi:MAG: proton-conducting transporter membrane subunit, partial [Oscillospiraceae bacterium]